MKVSRSHAFDLLCGLCIVRMICLHIMDFCGVGEVAWWKTVMAWSFYFMCFFFFKAGYFNKGVEGSTSRYLVDRTKRLFVPYLSAGLIGMAVYFAFLPFLLNRYHAPIEPLYWEHVWETSSFYGNRPTWFLFSFFVAYILVHFIEKVRHLHWVVLVFPYISYALYDMGNPLWMDVNNVFMGIFFFYVGHVWRLVMERCKPVHVRWASVAMIVTFGLGNVYCHGEYTMSVNNFQGQFLPVMINTVLALCGLAGLLLSVNVPRIPGICYIGEHSMVFFVSHYPMLYFYKFMHLSFGRSIWNHMEEVYVLVPAVFCMCAWLVPWVERVPWLSGRWPKAATNNK